ncbi:MAG: hypothetical protein P8X48_10495 [Acidiferrobacteraceae bacterium]|jgi:hypothetical protein
MAALLLSACAAKQAYEGKKLPAEQVALIKGSYHAFGTSTSITAIDGKRGMTWTTGEVEALPGSHELELLLQSPVYGVYTFSTYARARIAFMAEAGHVYRVEGKIRHGKVWAWILDEGDNSIVGGTKP